MKRRSIIELTPLLDVILLLIFAFLINMQTESDSMEEKYSRLEEKYESALELNSELEETIDEYEAEQSKLKTEINDMDDKIKIANTSNSEEKQTLEDSINAFSELVGISEGELAQLLYENEQSALAMSEIIDTQDTVLELYKYNQVMQRFFFIDIELKGEDNRVYINSRQTSIVISRADSQSRQAKSTKTLKIYDELKKEIDSRQGGDEMVMVILIVRDPSVYQYAYEIAWDALRELEISASGYRLFKASYTYIDQ